MGNFGDYLDFVRFVSSLPRARELLPSNAVAVLDDLAEFGHERVAMTDLQSVIDALEYLPDRFKTMLLEDYALIRGSEWSRDELLGDLHHLPMEPVVFLRPAGCVTGLCIQAVAGLSFDAHPGFEHSPVRLEIVAGTSQEEALRFLKAMIDVLEHQWKRCISAGKEGAEVHPGVRREQPEFGDNAAIAHMGRGKKDHAAKRKIA